MSANASTGAGRRRFAAVGARTRLIVMLVAGVVAAITIGALTSWGYAPLAGWDAAAFIFSAWVWLSIRPMSAAATAEHAVRDDPGRALTDLIVLVACVASLTAVGYVLIEASSAKGAQQSLLAGLGVGSIAVSWLTVHFLFTLRYARLYYTDKPGGVNFNQDEPPRYLDFAYLAFTIGMTFQVSDTDLESPAIRHSALRHALLSYLFGAVILASTINLVAGLGSGGGGGGGGGGG